jgi:hypothetical protein
MDLELVKRLFTNHKGRIAMLPKAKLGHFPDPASFVNFAALSSH